MAQPRTKRSATLSLQARVERLLTVKDIHESVTASMLFCLAAVFSTNGSATVPGAVDLLYQHGLRSGVSRKKLTQRLEAATRDHREWFKSWPGEVFVPRGQWVLEVESLCDERGIPRVKEAPAVAKAPLAPKAPVAEKVIAKPAPIVPSPPPAPSLPEAPAFVAATTRWVMPARALFVDALRTHDGGRGAVDLALRAQRLNAAQQFDELLSLTTMTGVSSYPYQVETVRRVLRVFRGRGILADEVGLGKTVEALMVLKEYFLRAMVRRVLVLVPAGLVGQWCEELATKAHIAPRSSEEPALREAPEAFWQSEGVVVASLALARHPRHADFVRATAWDMVVVDEAHRVKHRTTASYKLVDGLRARFLLLLTATPVENDLEELYNLVTLLRPGQFEGPAAFRREYVDPKDPTSPRNRERLKSLLAEVMVRNTRAQSGVALPPRVVTTVTVTPDETERALYEATVALFRTHGQGATRLTTSTLLLEAGSSPAALRGGLDRMLEGGRHKGELLAGIKALRTRCTTLLGGKKAEALADILRASGDATLIFTRYRDTLAHLVEVMQALGVSYGLFHGGMDAAARRGAVEGLRDGRTRVLLATDAGAEGHNLQFCHQLINFDLPWNPMVIEQRIGRLHRMGQTEVVKVFNLAAKGTIEDRVLEVLDRRVHLFELVVGEMDMVLGNMTDDRDLEERLLSLYAEAASEADIDAGFDALADELLSARRGYDRTRKLDEALFGRDFES